MYNDGNLIYTHTHEFCIFFFPLFSIRLSRYWANRNLTQLKPYIVLRKENYEFVMNMLNNHWKLIFLITCKRDINKS